MRLMRRDVREISSTLAGGSSDVRLMVALWRMMRQNWRIADRLHPAAQARGKTGSCTAESSSANLPFADSVRSSG